MSADSIAPSTAQASVQTSDPRLTARRLSRQVAADMVAIGDALSVMIGGLLPALIYAVYGDVKINQIVLLQATAIAGFIAHLCLRLRGMYDTSRMDQFPQDPVELLVAVMCGMGGVIGIGLPLALGNIQLVVWYLAWFSASFTMILFNRIVSRKIISELAQAGRFDERVAVFGAGLIARRVHDTLRDGSFNIHFVGVYDDRMGQDRCNPEGLSVSGRLDDLVGACRQGRVDKVVIALPQSAADRVADIVGKFTELPVSTHVVTHIASDLVDSDANLGVSSLGPVGLLDVKKKALIDWAPVTKRLEDILLGSAIAILIAPLLPIIALAIKLESPGPVFFCQRRRGRYQTVISIYKFRSMTVLEDGATITQATKGDGRITMVGRFLRRTSLDELPQLLNVLRGEMSLVGPRPHALAHDEEFSRMLDIYPNRHQMRPGMTGLAQIKGLRGSTAAPGSIEARLEADLKYVKAWSLWLDIKILASTIFAVIAGKNAD